MTGPSRPVAVGPDAILAPPKLIDNHTASVRLQEEEDPRHLASTAIPAVDTGQTLRATPPVAGGQSWSASRRLCLLFFVIGLFFCAMIPPFQSPDEVDHIKRAYFLTQGYILLEAPPGNASGGMVDSGLASYWEYYRDHRFKPDRKVTREEEKAAGRIRWSGAQEFTAAPGTGYYFPLIYLPHAVGLATGKAIGWTVERTYYFTRLIVLATVCLLLLLAFNLHAPSPLTLALLIMPMSVFQFASASLDGVSTAVAVVGLSAFLRMSKGSRFSPLLFYTLLASVALVTACRVHLLPMWALVLVIALQARSRKFFLLGVLTLLLVLGWVALAIGATVDTRQSLGGSTSDLAFYYLSQPLRFLEVLANTFSSREMVTHYRDSFIGVLGWLDTRFSADAYFYVAIGIALVALFSLSVQTEGRWLIRATLLSAALVSSLLAFFAMLITWTPHPAHVIHGVQGRYLLVPALMTSFAVTNRLAELGRLRRQAALLLLSLLAAFTIFGSTRLLIQRYYQVQAQPAHVPPQMHPSRPLTPQQPISLSGFETLAVEGKVPATIGILFGTYSRRNEGSAELRMWTNGGDPITIPFELAELADNHYRFFEVDPAPYMGGEIAGVTGGGVSTWELHHGSTRSATPTTCLVFRFVDGTERWVQGCTHP
jgi:hypothetical protein